MLPGLPAMLDQLIRTPSVSCSTPDFDMGNRDVVNLLAGWLETLGFAVQIMDIPGQPDKANLIAQLGSGPGGLVLAGHTDTVPFDEHRWQVNPLALTERDNRYYGLGSTDMKGFFPVAIEAARAYAGAKLKEPLFIVATADEESSMDGARQLVVEGVPRARVAVIGEPTDLTPVRLHKGIMMESVTVTGRSGHSSDPALGNNALEAMHEVLGALLAYRSQLQSRYSNPAFSVSVPTLNLGCIHGGDNPNRICGECELHFDLRPLPGMNSAQLRSEIQHLLTPIAGRLGVNIQLRSLFPGIEPFEQPANSAWVQTVERIAGRRAEAVAFGTEAPFLQQLGIDTVVLGPGSIRQAHQPDEYLEMSQIQPAINLLKQLIQQCCL
ncbi:MAG TPA: acetylornithine deacetylase [Spongiibacteraceae bacterium]|nr:acetylornithine deacetylase [Spongiibacteraceae bacterium]